MPGTSPGMTAETDASRSYPDHPQPQRSAQAVMRVRDRDSERVGGVGGFRFGLGQQNLQHHQNLVLVGVAGADHGLLDLVRRIFRNRNPKHRRRQHRDAPRLSKFQGGDAVLVDKSLLDCGLRRLEITEHGGKSLIDRQQAARQRQAVSRFHRTAAEENQPVTLDLDHAPPGAAQARIDAKDADGLANRRGGHGGVITPERRGRNRNSPSSPRKRGSSTPRPVDRSQPSLEYWVARSSRAMTTAC